MVFQGSQIVFKKVVLARKEIGRFVTTIPLKCNCKQFHIFYYYLDSDSKDTYLIVCH